MGQLVMTVVGGGLGFLVGGPMGASIGMTLGGMAGATLFGPTVQGPRLSDLKVSASTYGNAIPELYGTMRVSTNMIWSSGIKETKKTQRAGKGGPKQTTYSYDASFAMALCKGPVDKVLRIWADGKLIYDAAGGSTQLLAMGSGFAGIIATFAMAISGQKKSSKFGMRFYKGDDTQLPDSLIEADKGVGNVSAHRGLAYIVFERFQLEDFGNRIPQITVEVTKIPANTYPNVTATDEADDPLPDPTSRGWLPDWSSGYAVSLSGSTETVDLSTMKVVSSSAVNMSTNSPRQRYIPELGLFFREIGAKNSRQVQVYDARTATLLYTMGNAGSSVGGIIQNSCKQFVKQYSALGTIGYGHANGLNGRRTHIMFSGWTRALYVFRLGAEDIPIWRGQSQFVPSFIISGRDDRDYSQMIAYRNANSRLELEIFEFGYERDFKIQGIPTPGGCSPTPPSYDYTTTGRANQYQLNLVPLAGQTFSANVVLFDQTDDHLFVVGTSNGVPTTFKYSLDTGTYKFIKQHAGLRLPSSMRYSRLNGGTFGYGTGSPTFNGSSGRFVEIDLQTGDLRRNIAYGNAFGNQNSFGGQQHWDDVTGSIITETSGAFRRIAFRDGASKLLIGDIVADVCRKTNVLTDEDLDITDIGSGEVIGYLIDRETTARDVLKQLGTGYLFDCYESDYKLKFKARGDDANVVIPESWVSRDNEGIVLNEVNTQELELPMRVSVKFYDVARDYQEGVQSAKRNVNPNPTMWAAKEDTIELPIAWGATDAKQCADKILKMSWANRFSFSFTLPWRYLKYDPSDIVQVNMDSGNVFTIRMSQVDIGADFTLSIRGVSEKAASYVSNAVGIQGGSIPAQVIGLVYPAAPLVVNTPLLRDIDNDNNFSTSVCYLSAVTNALVFNGAYIYTSAGGVEYESTGYVSNDSVSGYCLNALPATNAYESTDEETILRVRLTNSQDTLESVTQEEMLTEFANPALVGDEVIQFRDAALQTDGTWWLTGILRARRGTNYAVNKHVGNERFLMLNDASLIKLTTPTSAFSSPVDTLTNLRNTSLSFKAVTEGSYVEDATSYRQTITPRDLQPFTPEHVSLVDDGTTCTLGMQRRSRITAPLLDGTGTIPYAESQTLGSARIRAEIWTGKTVEDIDSPALGGPDITPADFYIYDSVGNDLEIAISFPRTGATRFLVKTYEVGAIEGIPKWVQFDRSATGEPWDFVEYY